MNRRRGQRVDEERKRMDGEGMGWADDGDNGRVVVTDAEPIYHFKIKNVKNRVLADVITTTRY